MDYSKDGSYQYPPPGDAGYVYSQPVGPPPDYNKVPPPGGYAALPPGPGAVYSSYPGTTAVIVQPTPAGPRPNDYLILSLVTLVCCNPIFGCIGLLLSMQSRSAAQAGDYDRAKSSGKGALVVCIVGMILGVICVIGIIVYYVVVINAIARGHNG